MDGYITSYVNLIADNLRDRYENGFPILKELIQNADDAKARTLIFGRHVGFPNASHPLLQGSGLWFFNDGEFKRRDAHDLRSFGITSKAGDTSVIGKFGLGMKSVFHLCEALFYVAWDGEVLHREGLTPWKQEDHWPHPEVHLLDVARLSEAKSSMDVPKWLESHGISLHTSDHASVIDLQRFAGTFAPRTLVPIHSFETRRFGKFFHNVVEREDHEWWEV